MKRDAALDFLKGTAIILMVLGHALNDWPEAAGVRSFIYLFHMPVFFIASGYVFNVGKVQNSQGVRDFGWRRIKRLWFPYVLWTGVFTILNTSFLKWHIVSGEVSVCRQLAYNAVLVGRTELTSALWFIQSLFWASIAYAVVCWACSRRHIDCIKTQSVAAITCLVLSAYISEGGAILQRFNFLFNGTNTLRAYAMIHIGVVLARCRFDIATFSIRSTILSLLIAVGVLMCAMHCDACLIKYVISALSGWVLIMALYRLIDSRCKMTGLMTAITYIGQHTLPILIFHFLAFKIVNLAGVLLSDDPLVKVAAFPIAYHGVLWATAYVFAGITLPLWLNCLYRCMMRFGGRL